MMVQLIQMPISKQRIEDIPPISSIFQISNWVACDIVAVGKYEAINRVNIQNSDLNNYGYIRKYV